jgi:phospho-N-acetylmuramoyl-pentapeptide-transferase
VEAVTGHALSGGALTQCSTCFYEWLKDGDADSARYLNFLRYPTFRIVAAAVGRRWSSGMVLGPKLIRAAAQSGSWGISNVREDTPESHQKKKGTPTLGGALILLEHLRWVPLLFADLRSRVVLVALLMTAGLRLHRVSSTTGSSCRRRTRRGWRGA